MKQFSFLFIVVILSSTTQAQLNKGQWLVGGNASFLSTHDITMGGGFFLDDKFASLDASPDAGYFIMSKLAVGLRPGLGLSYDRSIITNYNGNYFDQIDESHNTSYSIAPFVRYYFLPAKNKINLLVDLSYSYNHNRAHGKNTATYIDSTGISSPTSSNFTNKYHQNGVLFSAGTAIFLNRNVAIEILAGYSLTGATDTRPKQNALYINAGFQCYLGH